ncbi:FxsB family radical SAM/SPASM domain protein [Nonomuraea sp. NBC_01738]|uniref:FxsB family cyclophane-forming radical SAM/SPASM peptide maturase n=1 Tax=Nonomuraea sp. NBC_01738 TaxID=2976003 RepID=UPI002E0DFE38|nr:FxsB family radical SAM/SPASM domain protein [Nonomuraea sp. NBC_01738]
MTASRHPREIRHPAWPHRTLEAPGHRPRPLAQFVLKIHSRCNLACSYCYVYEREETGWQAQPVRMSPRTLRAAAARIGEHATTHELPSVRVVMHGGEPLLAGVETLRLAAAEVRSALPYGTRLELVVQTNGVLLTRAALTELAGCGYRIGVSLDGAPADHDRRRTTRSGRGTHAAVARALDLLRTEFPEAYGGLLCVVDPGTDPVATYESLLTFAPPMIDFLLPHGTWTTPPPGRTPGDPATPYADWLLAIFTRWYGRRTKQTSIRLFEAIMGGLLGAPGGSEAVGLAPSDLAVIDTDGSLRQSDALNAAYDGAWETGLDVFAHPIDALLAHPVTIARQLGPAALAPACTACELVRVCGGGFFPHRYRAPGGFRNPSVYCPDLFRLIDAVACRVRADLG